MTLHDGNSPHKPDSCVLTLVGLVYFAFRPHVGRNQAARRQDERGDDHDVVEMAHDRNKVGYQINWRRKVRESCRKAPAGNAWRARMSQNATIHVDFVSRPPSGGSQSPNNRHG